MIWLCFCFFGGVGGLFVFFLDGLGENAKLKSLSLADFRACVASRIAGIWLNWHSAPITERSLFSILRVHEREGEFPQRMDLQLYPHMINITQAGLCTGSSMSNYGPTVSWLRANTMPKAASRSCTDTSHRRFMWVRGWCHRHPDFMMLSPRLIEQRQKPGSRRKTSSWQQPSRNTVGIWVLASIKTHRWCVLASVFSRFSNT